MHRDWQLLTQSVDKQSYMELQVGCRWIQSLAETADFYPLTHSYSQYFLLFPFHVMHAGTLPWVLCVHSILKIAVLVEIKQLTTLPIST